MMMRRLRVIRRGGARGLIVADRLATLTLTRSQVTGQSSALEADNNTLRFFGGDAARFNGRARRLLLEGQRPFLGLTASDAPATQSITVTAVAHTLSFRGTGTVTRSGASVGTTVGTSATAWTTVTFTPTAGSLTLTISGDVRDMGLEIGAFRSSYVPTNGVGVTRGADIVTAALSALGVGGNGACTIWGAALLPMTAAEAGRHGIVGLDDNGVNNAWSLVNVETTTNVALRRDNGGASLVVTLGARPVGSAFGFALTVDGAGAARACLAGAAVFSATGGVTSGLTTLRVGASQGVNNPMFGEVGPLFVRPGAVTDATLQALAASVPL